MKQESDQIQTSDQTQKSNPTQVSNKQQGSEEHKTVKQNKWSWIALHFPIILYTWFWFGLILCAIFAPSDRVLMLKSQVITEGWHLIVLSLILGVPIIVLYWRRVTLHQDQDQD